MDNPQYSKYAYNYYYKTVGFKPYYKWITLNTKVKKLKQLMVK